jgi:hypothetical protein
MCAVAVFVAVHLHLLLDLLGSRGPRADDIWPILYLAPLSDGPILWWAGQWELTSWQNTLVTLCLLFYVFWRATRSGYSPVELFSRRADRTFADTLQRRFGYLRQ